MTGEVIKRGVSDLDLGRQDEPQNIMAVIARAAADPACDVSKMQALLNMKMQMEARDAEVEFNAALARLMPKLPRIEKDGIIKDRGAAVRSKYARYETIDLIIRPLLADEGFSISFDVDDSAPGYAKVTGTLSHRMGHSRQSKITVPTASQVITGAQAVGSAVSFAKRYIVVNLLNIVTVGTDNDGQGDPDPISAEQVLTIDTMLKDVKADPKRFLALFEVTKIEDILARDYQKALNFIQAKRRQP